MKRIIRILILAVISFAGITTLSAQTVQVIVTQKVPVLPATATNYLDDPFRYFNVQFIVNGAGGDGLDVFLGINFTGNTSSFYARTKNNKHPFEPIHLQEGINIFSSAMDREKLKNQLRNGRLESNVYEINAENKNPLKAQQLPEGTYQLCVDVFRWEDQSADPESIANSCPEFDICYSGTAPELISPMAGAQMALNGALVVTPSRKVNFLWTPAISNCAGRNAQFKYMLKVVKVLNGQNYRDAIKYNPTVFSAEVRNSTYAILDTLRDIKVPLERGSLYVAQVQAEQIKSNRSTGDFVLGNDGKSQPMPFFWDVPDEGEFGLITDDDDEEGDEADGVDGLTQWEGGVEVESELGTLIDEMKEQYLAGFIQDAATVANLTAAYPEERKYVPTPKRRYVQSDGYYTVPMTDDLEVSFMPARHESLKNVSYAIEIYDYISGGVDSITAYEPLLSERTEELPASYNKMDSHELITRTLNGWGAELTQGNLYYLQLSCFFTAGYWEYSIADTTFYVNEMLAEHVHDTVSRDFVEDQLLYSNGVFFQWGDDPDAPDFTTPQWKTPVDRSGDDIYDPVNYVIPATVPEMQKAQLSSVSWTPVKNVTKGDEVEYVVKVYELKPGQTLEEAIAQNEVLVSRTVTDANAIPQNDSKFFKVFSSKKTYVMTLSTNVYGESDTYYHFENGNEALPAVFKVVK